ncbi:uncharacterized protein LOC113227969 [Hyposmocoma kahamanoa]|uniref:uncharacterized protein LOC113227969 n=1 Tax=Hyposmocoma kahamanoa TaxID=1477025 RepID=UPI000E6D69B6|nr:uncharacterized protein LOC113227969 [Hyposmocoma kahamanoa]
MSEVSLSKFLWERGAMESCYKLYTWINHTLLMLLLQIFWKMSQISDFFKEKSLQEAKPEKPLLFAPLTKESKMRRHIRSMSDVQSSTPYRIVFRSRKGSTQTLMYDSDTRARRIRSYNRHLDSSDSSDSLDLPRKVRTLEQNILKHTDSMRIL